MAIRKSSSSGIPFGNTAGRPANPGIGQLYSNGQTARLELYTDTGWQNIVQETPGVASATGTYNQSTGSGTFTISGTNFVDGAIAYAVGTNGTEYEATSTTYNSLVQLTTVFSNLSAAYEPYDIKITNPSNLFGLLPDAFYINDTPVWTTAGGSLGSYANGSVSIQLAATDDESNSLTYSYVSGSLPSGLTVSSSGLISGTMTASAGEYSFVVSASDSFNTAVNRTFSITSTGPNITGGTLTSDSTHYYRTFTSNGNFVTSGALTADIFVLGGGGGANGNGNACGGGGAGGFRTSSSMSFSSATYQVVVGSGGSGSSDASSATNGNNSSINNFTSTGGGKSNTSGGSGGGGNRDGSTSGASGNSGGYSPVEGYAGGTSTVGGYRGAGGGGGSGAAGAGGGGGSATSEVGGAGGIGRFTTLTNSMALATSTGVLSSGNYYYGGGGGGGTESGGRSGRSAGGLGGGGFGCEGNNQPATSGSANTGSGGGGAGIGSGAGGAGGSGIVIIRYTKASVGG
jgi:hypothetical protein